MKFLHIPLQSGSDKILKDMKRTYSVEDFKAIVRTFRKNFPKITIATDVIVGYPTETEKDFILTYNLIQNLKPRVLNISKFSSRPRTEASKLPQLSSEIIKKRTLKINKLYQEIRNGLI
jgi:tRNA A37 methylthiotransferase MiaB